MITSITPSSNPSLDVNIIGELSLYGCTTNGDFFTPFGGPYDEDDKKDDDLFFGPIDNYLALIQKEK